MPLSVRLHYSIRLKTWPVENKKGNLGQFLIDLMNEKLRTHGYIYQLVFIALPPLSITAWSLLGQSLHVRTCSTDGRSAFHLRTRATEVAANQLIMTSWFYFFHNIFTKQTGIVRHRERPASSTGRALISIYVPAKFCVVYCTVLLLHSALHHAVL